VKGGREMPANGSQDPSVGPSANLEETGRRSSRATIGLLASTHPAALAGGLGCCLVLVMALTAPLLPLPNHLEGTMDEQYLAPSPVFREVAAAPSDAAGAGVGTRLRRALFGELELWNLMGTDGKGRDLCSRIVWGSRVSLTVAIVAALVSLVIGVLYGALAGFFGGLVDEALMRLVDVLYAVPFIFVVIYMVSILQEYDDSLRSRGISREVVLYVLIGAIYWLTMARVVRGQVLSLKKREFVCAAEAVGAGRLRIIVRHILPNTVGIVIVYLTLTIPRIMLFEAFLSFLGIGVEPPDVSWGLLASDACAVMTPVNVCWWLAFFPGAVLAVTLLCINLLGDGIRDLLDPRTSGRGE